MLTLGVLLQFPVSQYAQDIAANAQLTKEEVVAKLKRSSTGFSRYIVSLTDTVSLRVSNNLYLCTLREQVL